MSSDSRTLEALERLIADAVGAHEAMAAQLNINPTDLRCAVLIAAEPDMTPTRLAEVAGLTTGAITGVLDRLEREGVVQRVPDPDDRRRLTLTVAPARLGELRQSLAPLAVRLTGLVDGWRDDRRAPAELLLQLADAIAQEGARLRVSAHGGLIGNTYSCPRGDLERATLRFSSGAPRLSLGGAALGQQVRMVAEAASTRLRLRLGDDGADLMRAQFDGPVPGVRQAAGTVSIRYRRRLLDVRSRGASVALSPWVSWSIEVDGGVTDLEGDLRGVRLDELAIRGGANHLRLRLPQPSGTVRVSLDGGSSDIRIERPSTAAASLRVRGGASHLRFDHQQLGSVGDVELRSDGFASAADRYQIVVSGGTSGLRVTRG